MSENATAVHALEASTTHRRRKTRPEPTVDDKTEEYLEDEYAETESDEPPPSATEDCITFLVVLAVIAAMIAFFWLVFTQLATPGDLLAQRLQNAPKVEPKHLHLHVNLAQLYTGHTAHVDVDRQLVCRHCAGTGSDLKAGFHECHECKGSGFRTHVQHIGPIKQHVRSTCNVCKGRGQVANKKCDSCHGHGLLRDRTTQAVTIERGMRHGDTVTIPHEGDQATRKMPGDLVFHLHMDPHERFTRRGDDLEMELRISLLEALVGFTREVPHVDNRVVRLTRDSVVTPSTVWRLPGQGMPVRASKGASFGDLLVRFSIQYPTNLTAEEKQRVAELLA